MTQSLKKRFQLFAFVSAAAFLLFSFLGFWRIQFFTEKLFELRENSRQMESNLRENFESTKLIGDIHASLRLYIQLAEPTFLEQLHRDVETLSHSLPDSLQRELKQFLEMVSVLEVRMTSQRENASRLAATERQIMTTTRQLLRNVEPAFLLRIQNITGSAFLKHHHIYVNTLLTGQPDTLEFLRQESTTLFQEVYAQLNALIAELPATPQKHAKSLLETYLALEDAAATITAIRITTLRTQIEIEKQLNEIDTAIAKNSLLRLNSSSQFFGEGLSLARNNFALIVYSLIGFSLLFCLMAFYLNRRMIAPLLAFADLLKKTANILVGIRNHRVEQNDNYQALALLGDQRQDEIGDMAQAVKSLVQRMKDLFIFRQAIEADQCPAKIYKRLAGIFSEKFGLSHFIIFEAKVEIGRMEVVNLQPPELREALPPEHGVQECRANRTGHLITSLDDPQACSIFPFRDRFDHVCLPMLVGGSVTGVVEFLLPLTLSREEKRAYRERIEEASHFVAEALPMIQGKQLAAKLQEMAIRDQLTGLYNRHFLQESLPRLAGNSKRRGSQLSILICDLDRFKEINDQYGHPAGDTILVQFAKILVNSARESDLLVRFGGEEFMMILVDCDLDGGMGFGEKLRKSVEQYKFHTGGENLRLTISFGVSTFPMGEHDDIAAAIRRADQALYQAKEQGRNLGLPQETQGTPAG